MHSSHPHYIYSIQDTPNRITWTFSDISDSNFLKGTRRWKITHWCKAEGACYILILSPKTTYKISEKNIQHYSTLDFLHKISHEHTVLGQIKPTYYTHNKTRQFSVSWRTYIITHNTYSNPALAIIPFMTAKSPLLIPRKVCHRLNTEHKNSIKI